MTETFPILSALIALPLAAAVVVALMPGGERGQGAVRKLTLIVSLVEVVLSIPLLDFESAKAGFQFMEHLPWIPAWGLSYTLGIDGISLLMILLTVGILPLIVLTSWTYITKRVKEFHVCLLLMTAACVGVFCALDFVLFYLFWEAMLVPMYLLIAVWGGAERQYASIKFFLYTLAGSTLLLIAMVAFYWQGGTFSIPELMTTDFPRQFQMWTFLCMAFAFAIKVPMFPFHTWLPAAHVQAPAAGSVILASVLLKMGTYGFLRFCLPMCPAASQYFAPMMIGLAVASILYGGFTALGQRDIKKIIAYSSVGHMGFAMLGIFLFNLRGLEGALLVMLNHGIVTGGLFMMIGLIYERSHSRDMEDNQGLAAAMPVFILVFALFTLAGFGFPGTNSFVGEAAVLVGAFDFNPWLGAIVIPGALVAAAYMLRLGLRMAYGAPTSYKPGWWDLNRRELIALAPLFVLTLWLGLAPGFVIKVIDPAVTAVAERVASAGTEKGANPEILPLLSEQGRAE